MANSDPATSPRCSKMRLKVPSSDGQTLTITSDPNIAPSLAGNIFPAKEWAITDDVMNVSDAASVSIANDNGEVSGLFQDGQKVVLEESDPDVANGQWIQQFTGRIVGTESYSDQAGGSNIMLSMMDLGWHLTSCDAEPLKQIKNKKFVELLKILIDPSWGLAPTTRINSLARALGLPNPGALSLGDALGEAIITSNDLNRRIKHGRQIIMQNFKPQLGAVLPFIQIEPGQKPLDILKTYCARMGWLLNVGAQGEIIFFRPRFDTDPLYTLHFHSTRAEERTRNNIIGRPTIRTSLAERYSEVQTWSTVVIPPEIQNTENPNEMYRHSSVKASPNPVPFFRRHIVNDGEAINDQLRKNRATWEMQLGMFNAETYEAEFPAHSQDGAKFVSDTMISMNDTIHKWEGAHYVSSVHRSDTLRDGPRSRLTIHRPGLLNPELTALDVGGGARKALGK